MVSVVCDSDMLIICSRAQKIYVNGEIYIRGSMIGSCFFGCVLVLLK